MKPKRHKLTLADMVEAAHEAGATVTSHLVPKDQTVLQAAQELIYGQRQADYGDALESFSKVARIWEVILNCPVKAEQVCLCMDALKTVRLLHQPNHRDSVIDKAGYAGCYEKVMAGKAKVDK